MSVIQTIRDKAAWIIIAAIAIALIGFIVQDAFQGGGRGFFSGPSTTLGKVNGTKIDAAEFDRRYRAAEENYQRNAQYPVDENLRRQIRESLWNEYVENALMVDEYEELGLTVTEKEIGDILYGANPPETLRRQFTDSTGQYNGAAAYQAVRSLKKNTPEFASFHGEFVPAIIKGRQREKFVTLIANSAYVPKWLIEKTNNENSQRAAISYVVVPYSTVADSTITVTDEEVQQFINERKDAFPQEKARGISYVVFDAAPSKADSADYLSRVTAVKDSFATTTDINTFLITNGSETPFFDGFVVSSQMKMAQADTLKTLAEGAVYGPYLDGGNYVMAKMLQKRTLPDSVFCKHILIRVDEQKPGDDSVAKKRMDSIVAVINAGSNFDTVMQAVSDDKAATSQDGGVMKFTSMQMQQADRFDQDFAKYILFDGKQGERKVVKTKFGYHYIWITEQKNFEPAYKIAYFSRSVSPSNETVNSAQGLAAQFAGESRNLKQFEENAKKRNLNVFTAADIKPMDNMIMGIGDSRELVKWIFEADRGDVAEHPITVGDKVIVPVLTHAYEKGTMSVEKARPMVEYRIRNKKKAEQIAKKIGSAATLEAVAQATGQTVMRSDSIMFSSNFVPNLGQEPKVIGAAFNKSNQSKISAPIYGEMGVFVIKVENVSAVANPNFDAKQQQIEQQQRQRQMMGDRPVEVLKKAADIKDYRSKFY
jgi:peptidyl-prolyl cis-trans isomerase D